ncbi:MAG: long-chain-fatty-acid--CoA ligase [Thermoplasmata archaeon]
MYSVENVKTTVGLLEHANEKFYDRPAVLFKENEVSYAELYERSHRVASALLDMGLEKGDHVGVWMPNNHVFHVLFFGITIAGGVAVPMNTRYKAHEVRYIMNNSDSKFLFSVGRFLKYDYIEMLNQVEEDLDTLERVITYNGDPDRIETPTITYEEMLETGEDWQDNSELINRNKTIDGEDPAIILYTSGTTGQPKGAQLRHINIINNARVTGRVMEVTEEDRYYTPLPLFHSFGLVLGTLAPFTYGASIVLQDVFDSKEALKLMSEHDCTMDFGVPAMFIQELEEYRKHPNHYDLSSLRSGMMGGAPCPIEVVKGIINDMGCNVCIGYGITETSPLITLTRYDDPPGIRAESVGRPLPHVKVKIVDGDRNELPTEEIGEIAVKGDVMKGYYKMEDKTDEVIDEEGWYYTGDLGKKDDDGYVYVTGRKKDMIIVGGFNVYPREIEEFLFTLEGVQDAAVIGTEDPNMGEIVLAYVVPKKGAEIESGDIIEACKSSIANYKVPRKVKVVNELPRTASGKVQKYVLRDEAEDELKKND